MTADDLDSSQLSRGDCLLIARLQAGDAAAVAGIEQRYGDELRLFCRRMMGDAALAEDLVQDVLATCCRLEAGSLPTRSIRGWLYQICRRRCIDARRKQHDAAAPVARKARRAQPSYEHAVDPLTTPAGRALKRDRAAKILSVLEELDDDLRSVVVMRYLQDLPREEIAEAIGLSLAGTKARLSKAMQILRDKLQKLDDSTLR
ncbi:MAG: RNA polymerase sigma factor [Planctomycetes bacterium]|nr:RNA polymerase sigma factor [Planctomycetota bacterium]